MSTQTATQSVTNVVNGFDLAILKETIQAVQDEPQLGECHFRATNTWLGGSKNATTVGNFYGAGQENMHKEDYILQADEPPVLAGSDDAANPVEHLLHALASCVTTSLIAHAAVRGIEIEELESSLEGDIDLNGFLGIDPSAPKGYTEIRVNFRVKGDANVDELREIAELSPVYSTITKGANVVINFDKA